MSFSSSFFFCPLRNITAVRTASYCPRCFQLCPSKHTERASIHSLNIILFFSAFHIYSTVFVLVSAQPWLLLRLSLPVCIICISI